MTASTASLDDLKDALRRLGRVVVAFSGGADSSLVAKVAHDTLGRDAVLCVTALSPSLAGAEEADCRSLAQEWDLRWVGVPTSEMEDAAYVANGPDRCARCKGALMDAVGPLAAAESATVVLGVNVSDLGDHRPGQTAAAAAGAAFPLVEAGFTKEDIRRWSRELGLRTWDKPAAACLASRLPYGTPVTLDVWPPWKRPSRPCARSGSGSCGCATTATRPGWRSSLPCWPTWWHAGTRLSVRCVVRDSVSLRWTWKASGPAA